MCSRSRKMMILAAVLTLVVFVFPIWLIDLDAPQYPEGIGLHIWVNKITGMNPHDLKNINMLNHYIGMKEILPESIPELKILPIIIWFLFFTAILIAWKGKRKLALAWFICLIILGIVGIYDFYLWEYDYGHNLDPHAAIKIPGMTYQPPLFGTKQLLNMKTTSLPHIGSYALLLSGIFSYLAFYFDGKMKEELL